MNRYLIAFMLVALVSVSAILGSRVPSQPPPESRVLASAGNDFGFHLLGELNHEQPNQNIFISPTSIALALAMVYNGADGATREQMSNVLALQGFNLDSLNQAAGSFMEWLGEADPEVELDIANSVWYKQDFPFKQSFIDMAARDYDAAVSPLTTAGAINDWVSEKTHDKITSIVDRIESDDIMFLINAIYFKGGWKSQFPKGMTHEEDFFLLAGDKFKHQMMQQQGDFAYCEDSSMQAIILPYGNANFHMLVILPTEEFGYAKLLGELNSDFWKDLQRRLWVREGTIVLPRFRIEYDVTLNNALVALGMKDAFDAARADFSGMWQKSEGPTLIDSNVYIKEVRHKTYVDVNEEGTEAAAVTSIGMGLATSSIAESPRPFRMVVNRPFICAIVERQSGAILFLGGITDPRG